MVGSAAGRFTSTMCSGAAAPNYTISYVNGSLTVNPAPLSVVASSPFTTYGTAVTVTANYSGFVNGDMYDATSLTTAPTCTSTATAASHVGTYPTSCSGAVDPNYAITYITGTLIIGAAPLTITASSPTITYGNSILPITASYNGFVMENARS